MLPDPTVPGPVRLERRTPGETDLRIFTTEVLPASKHRPDGKRCRLRIVRDARAGRPVVRIVGLVIAALLTGCSSRTRAGEGGQEVRSASGSLKGICPATVVVQ